MKQESKFQTKVIRMLDSDPLCWVVKIIVCNKSGTMDLIGCYSGLFFGIECKRPDGKGITSELQMLRIREVKSAGGFATVAHDIETVEKFMRKVKRYARSKQYIRGAPSSS